MPVCNNLKQIRELYGSTQEQIAHALSINRVTVANWESGATVASSSNREKMSMYYGIGPEYFYDKELTDDVKQMIIRTAEKERIITHQSSGEKNKPDDFQALFSSITFDQAMRRYMFSMKLLLAKADDGELETLRTAYAINQKMGRRLAAIIDIRDDEAKSGDPSLGDLFDTIIDE